MNENQDISRDEFFNSCPIDFSVYHEHARKVMLATAYLKGKNELKMTEDESKDYAVKYVRRECMRKQLFRDAPIQNKSIRLLFGIPIAIFIILIALGLLLRTKWLFYVPALLLMFPWVLLRRSDGFWTPILYWFKTKEQDTEDWRDFFLSGETNIKMLINACYNNAHPLPTGVILRSFILYHLIFWGTFTVLAYFAWQ